MSNTVKRVVSAIVIVAIVIACLLQGEKVSLGLVFIFGFLVVDELFVNFFRKPRIHVQYVLAQATFSAPYIYLNFMDKAPDLSGILINLALFIDILLLFFLLRDKKESSFFEYMSDKIPLFAGLFSLVFFMGLSSLFHYQKFKSLFAVLILITGGMDSGAWIVGKNFGKHKLMPTVSPNKTIEGFFGGIFFATLLAAPAWHFLIKPVTVPFCFAIAALAAISQLGDLVQSKLKRQFNLKDSSSLIPGHGGVYDRLDSILFVSPFFAITLSYFYY
ncbi:MAG: phosphatidate cytidylyltransferase [Bacteriovoracaceae bacterium]|jgi:phosphatidate cytidylyltransferase|nr:phosphatidate cytidylyltransferase [Bacteriovoracaceae bacterium]